MARKDKTLLKHPTTIRFSEEDLQDLRRAQDLLGGLSQSDALKLLVKMFIGKVPAFQKQPKVRE